MATLITLTTDFGTGSPYVAAMKGVLATLAPAVPLVDLSHEIGPQDLVHAAHFLRDSIPYFPSTAIHVVVVDPQVGTDRRALLVEHARYRLLVPDNGIWTWLPETRAAKVRHLNNFDWFMPKISATFHGRDIFAPSAARWAHGTPTEHAGPLISDWQSLPCPLPKREGTTIIGEVLFIDRFGNAICNIPIADIAQDFPVTIAVGGDAITQSARTYGDYPNGSVVWLSSSSGWLEIAEVGGNAAQKLGVERGAPVIVTVQQ